MKRGEVMQVIYNSKVKQTVYKEKLENGLTVMIIPKKGVQKNTLFGEHTMAQMIINLLCLGKMK